MAWEAYGMYHAARSAVCKHCSQSISKEQADMRFELRALSLSEETRLVL